jgi:zinc transport system ATP-binding protein
MKFRNTKEEMILDIKELSYTYDKDMVLDNINLQVFKNNFLAIIGPNGGGKSTLLKLILGLLKPKKGMIKLFNTSIKESISKIGYVPQNTNINTNFPIKVLDVVKMGHISKNKSFISSKEEVLCAMGALNKVSMQDFANTKIGSLSGGQRQRVMIARALCANPELLILDEPTASIDVTGQKQIYELLQELNKTISIIVVSHDISVILSYATKVAHINKQLVFHDIRSKKHIAKDGHFCEVEMLELLGECKC